MSSYLLDLAGVRTVQSDGTELVASSTLNFSDDFAAAYDPATRRINVSLTTPGDTASGDMLAVRLATTGDHPLSGLADIDDETPVAGDIVLVRANTNPVENGLYTAAAGSWTRAPEGAEIHSMSLISVAEGTQFGREFFVVTTLGAIVLDTTELAFSLIRDVPPGHKVTFEDEVKVYRQSAVILETSAVETRLRVGAGGTIGFYVDAAAIATVRATELELAAGMALDFADEVAITRQGASVLESTSTDTSIHTPAPGGFITFHDEATEFAGMGMFGSIAIFAFVEIVEGLIAVEGRTTADPGQNITIRAGAGGLGDQDGGGTYVDAGAPSGAGLSGPLNLRDGFGTTRIQIQSNLNVAFIGDTQVQTFVGNDLLMVVERSGGDPRLALHDGASGTSSTFTLQAVTPSGDRNGLSVGVIGGDAGGPSSNNGGNAFLRGGPRSGSGSDGTAELQDSDGVARVIVAGGNDKNVTLKGEVLVSLLIGASTIAYVDSTALRAIGLKGSSSGNNAFLHAAPSGWNSMTEGIFVGNAGAVPTAGDTGGVYVYASGGALYARGGSGTITPLAAA